MLSSPSIVSVTPAENSVAPVEAEEIVIQFDQVIDPAAATASVFAFGSQTGRLADAPVLVAEDQTAVRFTLPETRPAGEPVQVTVTSQIRNAVGETAQPYVWQYRNTVTAGTGHLGLSEFSWSLPPSFDSIIFPDRVADVALADMDGDGDLDVLAQQLQSTSLWLNDGRGQFASTGKSLGTQAWQSAAIGDLDGDGDQDVLTAKWEGAVLWRIDGQGDFKAWGQPGRHLIGRHGIVLGDVDGDGDLDALGESRDGGAVWLTTEWAF